MHNVCFLYFIYEILQRFFFLQHKKGIIHNIKLVSQSGMARREKREKEKRAANGGKVVKKRRKAFRKMEQEGNGKWEK